MATDQQARPLTGNIVPDLDDSSDDSDDESSWGLIKCPMTAAC
jgi:hypothetical protein